MRLPTCRRSCTTSSASSSAQTQARQSRGSSRRPGTGTCRQGRRNRRRCRRGRGLPQSRLMRRCRCWSMVPPRRGRFVMMTASRCAGSATGRASASASDGHGSASGLGDVQRRNYMHCRSSQITEQGSGGGGTGSSGSRSVGTGRVGGRCWNLLRIIIFVRLLLVGHAVWYLFYVCTRESRYVLPLCEERWLVWQGGDCWPCKVQHGLLTDDAAALTCFAFR